jgi:hypothetical protein
MKHKPGLDRARARGANRARATPLMQNGGFPGLPALLRLAGALGVPVERFAEGVEDPAGDEAGSGEGETAPGAEGEITLTD